MGTKLQALGAVVLAAFFSTTAFASAISSMTIVDVDGDTVSGAFRFGPINFNTYAGTSCFNSDGAPITGCPSGSDGGQLQGAGTDDGILFGRAQDVGAISPGFMFFRPFQPRTTGAPVGSVDWNPNASRYELTLTSFPWAGLFNDLLLFPLHPDPEPAEPCVADEVQSGGVCVRFLEKINDYQFNYAIRWSHLITLEGDPSGGSFEGQHPRWALEGVITVVPIPAAAWLFLSGLAGLVGLARRRRV